MGNPGGEPSGAPASRQRDWKKTKQNNNKKSMWLGEWMCVCMQNIWNRFYVNYVQLWVYRATAHPSSQRRPQDPGHQQPPRSTDPGKPNAGTTTHPPRRLQRKLPDRAPTTIGQRPSDPARAPPPRHESSAGPGNGREFCKLAPVNVTLNVFSLYNHVPYQRVNYYSVILLIRCFLWCWMWKSTYIH